MPAFSVADQDGNIVTNESLMGRKSVIYFYPKDSTPGCTAEACNIRDNYQAFLAKGYTVIGVSKDSQKSHQNFIAKYELPFPLIADIDVFDENGTLERIIDKVDTKNHTAQIITQQ